LSLASLSEGGGAQRRREFDGVHKGLTDNIATMKKQATVIGSPAFSWYIQDCFSCVPFEMLSNEEFVINSLTSIFKIWSDRACNAFLKTG